MTISSNLSTVTRNGNGVATSFSFPFKVWDTSQLDVYITDPSGTTTATSNFTATLSGSGGNVVYPAAGGVILPTGWKIIINRNMPFTQNVDLVNGQAFYPDVIEQALDQLTATCQQLDEGLSRSVKVEPGQTDPAALLTQIQAAVTNSGNSATAAASSASAAADSEVAVAASAAAAQAAAATLSPATTTARGIGRVATSADLVDGATINNGPAFLAAGSEAVTTTPTPNAVPQADANGTLDAWTQGKANTDLSNVDTSKVNIVLQQVRYETGAVATGSTAIPFDDTAPQNTEGTQVMSLTFIPKRANSILKVEVLANAAPATSTWVSAALFRDANTSAVAACSQYTTTGGVVCGLKLSYTESAGAITPTTFSVRVGATDGSVTTFNGAAGSRKFGGVLTSSIVITEYAV